MSLSIFSSSTKREGETLRTRFGRNLECVHSYNLNVLLRVLSTGLAICLGSTGICLPGYETLIPAGNMAGGIKIRFPSFITCVILCKQATDPSGLWLPTLFNGDSNVCLAELLWEAPALSTQETFMSPYTYTHTHICVCKYMCMHLSLWKSVTPLHFYSSQGDFEKSIKKGRKETDFPLQQEKAIKHQILTVPGSKFFHGFKTWPL